MILVVMDYIVNRRFIYLVLCLNTVATIYSTDANEEAESKPYTMKGGQAFAYFTSVNNQPWTFSTDITFDMDIIVKTKPTYTNGLLLFYRSIKHQVPVINSSNTEPCFLVGYIHNGYVSLKLCHQTKTATDIVEVISDNTILSRTWNTVQFNIGRTTARITLNGIITSKEIQAFPTDSTNAVIFGRLVYSHDSCTDIVTIKSDNETRLGSEIPQASRFGLTGCVRKLSVTREITRYFYFASEKGSNACYFKDGCSLAAVTFWDKHSLALSILCSVSGGVTILLSITLCIAHRMKKIKRKREAKKKSSKLRELVRESRMNSMNNVGRLPSYLPSGH